MVRREGKAMKSTRRPQKRAARRRTNRTRTQTRNRVLLTQTSRNDHLSMFLAGLVVVISVVLSLILLFGGRWIFSLYFKEEHILDMGVLICRFMTVIILLQISQIIFTGTLRAAGDVRYTLIVALI